MKTPQEIKVETLAECERICIKQSLRYDIGNNTHLNRSGAIVDDTRFEFSYRNQATGNHCHVIDVWQSMHVDDPRWLIAYRLLGIEQREMEQTTLVKALRSFTGCASEDCKKALEANDWDCYRAATFLRSSGPRIKEVIENAVKPLLNALEKIEGHANDRDFDAAEFASEILEEWRKTQ